MQALPVDYALLSTSNGTGNELRPASLHPWLAGPLGAHGVSKPFLVFAELPGIPGMKTKRWQVRNTSGGHLGSIRWHASWRRYCYFPDVRSLYDPSCLREITDFLERQTASQKDDQARRRALR